MMQQVKQIVKSTPTSLFVYTCIYLVVLGGLRWTTKPDITALFYLCGGVLGVYFMDIAELIFDIKPSPFHSILFLGLFAFVSFFVVTSSGNMFATGLVLSLFFNLVFAQVQEWMAKRNLSSWFTLTEMNVTPQAQLWILIGTALILVVESVIFIR